MIDSEIVKELEDLDELALNLEITLRNDIKKINLRRRELQKLCSHSSVVYIPDASGNNDSCNCCSICGLEKKWKKDFEHD